MDQLLDKINQLLAREESLTLLTVIEINPSTSSAIKIGNKRLLSASGEILGSLGDALLDEAVAKEAAYQAGKRDNDTLAISTDKFQAPENAAFAASVAAGRAPLARVLIEVVRSQPRLFICGAGHIARALAQFGLILGFRAIILDDRAEFANRAYFPDARIELIAEPFETAVKQIKVTANTAIVIVTRGHKHDEDCLRQLLASPAQYIGMIGSRRRVGVVREKLLAEGFISDQLDRIYAPIGLNIGARSPEEIALAILAEIVLVRNRGKDHLNCTPLSKH
jgi:xanthine dehydrogenase accessory factor